MKRANEKTLCESCPSRVKSVFHNITTTDLSGVDRDKSCYMLKRGEVVFNEGNLPHGLYCVKKGKIKIFKTGNEGKDQIIKFAKPGDVIGYRSLLSGEKYTSSASCIEETEICFIPKTALLDMVTTNSCLAMNLMKVACHELGDASKIITNLAQKSTRERLAEMILILKENFGLDNEGSIDVTLTREEIANLVGTATESVIRLLAELKEEGLIELNGKRIVVINQQGLIRVGKVTDL